MSSSTAGLGPSAQPSGEVPTTGDEAVDAAMDQLRSLLEQPAAEAGRRDAEVLAAVHDALQRRLSATAG